MIAPLKATPLLVEQAYQAIVDEICDGTLPAGTHLVQEQLARDLGVSRQPIQQVMTLLKADGLVENAPGRGLRVAGLDLERMWRHYDIRAVLDGLAARHAANRAGETDAVARELEERGSAIIDAGNRAVANEDVKRMVDHDAAFHGLLYEVSGNPLIASTVEAHWRHLRRVMGEVLRRAGPPALIWQEHGDILDAAVAGDCDRAEQLAIRHIERAGEGLTAAIPNGRDDAP